MIRTRFCIALVVPLLLMAPVIEAQRSDEPYRFFREFVGLSEDQIGAIRSGKPVAKVIESRTPDEVFVFGSVYVEASPESYIKLASDVDALRKLPGYLAIQSFSDPPQLSDLEGFTLEKQDIDELKNCKVGHCEVQLPTEAMEDIKQSIDWSAPDVANRVNHLARQMAFQALLNYMNGGNAALGVYRDKNHPAAVAETFAALITRLSALPEYLPELNEYLLEYPKAKSDKVQAGFYWEEVNFGLKPTFRIVQRVVYQRSKPNGPCLRISRETALRKPLLRNGTRSHGLRQRCATPRLLHHYRQRVEAGRPHRTKRKHRAQGGRRQSPILARTGPRDDKTDVGITPHTG